MLFQGVETTHLVQWVQVKVHKFSASPSHKHLTKISWWWRANILMGFLCNASQRFYGASVCFFMTVEMYHESRATNPTVSIGWSDDLIWARSETKHPHELRKDVVLDKVLRKSSKDRWHLRMASKWMVVSAEGFFVGKCWQEGEPAETKKCHQKRQKYTFRWWRKNS